MIVWQEFEALAADNPASSVSLSPESLTLFLSTFDDFDRRTRWIQDNGEEVTDAQWDDIEAITAKAFTEIMTAISTVQVGAMFPVATSALPPGSLLCDGATYLRVDYPDLYAALESAFIVDADHFRVPDMRGRAPIGAGTGTGLSTYAPGDTGGQETHALSTAELAAHSHTIAGGSHNHSFSPTSHGHNLTDGGHSHATNDPGHNHAVTDPGHTHATAHAAGAANATLGGGGNNVATNPPATTVSNTTGLTVNNNTTGITSNPATTGATVDNAVANGSIGNATPAMTAANTGSGTAHENRQPYLALRWGIWA